MATLVLTVVGTALGGPVGGAIGAAIGNAFDQNILFKPKGREGPRLAELDVQTSTYGSQVPKIFGGMRVAGTVIWATDLRETKNKNGGGKGKPSVTSYSYSVSFAVALSSRSTVRIGRIWADGNLLRGAAGDFKTEVGAFRLCRGSPDQSVDPLIASAEGMALTPAYRDITYAVFEDMQLADYGNRIPSLTFEVIADEGAVTLTKIAGSLSRGVLEGSGSGAVSGYAASGQSIADAIEPLVSTYGLRLRPVSDALVLDGSVTASREIPPVALAGRVNGRAVMPLSVSRQAAALVPQSLSLRHYDATRDYQAGLQKAARPGPGRRQAQIDLPAVISAGQAKQLAGKKIAALWKGRNTMDLVCGWSQLAVSPGSVVAVSGTPGLWSVENWQWEAMAVKLSLRQIATASIASVEASSGGSVREADVPSGITTLYLADLPRLEDGAASVPIVVAAAAGASTAWRRAALFVEQDGEVTGIGQTGLPAIMGSTLSNPMMGSAVLFDDVATLDVELLAEDMVLAGASDDALLRGANLCLVGEELLQFGQAQQTGLRRYRLSRLLRGRRGTEWAMDGHASGERFLLIDADSLQIVPDQYVRTGDSLALLAIGVGDVEPVAADIMVAGNALRPPSPVHLQVVLGPIGDRSVSWVRRSRTGWTWDDHIDAPLGEEFERYRLRILAGSTVLRTVETSMAGFLYSATMAATDEAAGGSVLALEVVQIGARGMSRPLSCPIIL
ncbi:phage tail protein [Rhizorhapis sp. SPR117]|uniref:phage tail protein n=1 Tax=Rhizorhapis sp. SPR117 TaxID=2912611 RepID=UPI001F4128EB|nr:phage tail protein [Rhizorhapis sp. SPR117]